MTDAMDTHKRDGSLVRKKQEQWARERAEGSKGVWFPFGSPGGGTPNRKFEAIDYSVPPKTPQVSLSQGSSSAYGNNDATLPRSTSQSQPDVGGKVTIVDEKHYQTECVHRPTALPSQLLPSHQHPPLHSPTTTCAFPVPASAFHIASAPMTVPWGYLQPFPISVIPPGTVPIPIQDPSMSVAEGKPKHHVSAAEQLAQMNPTNFCWASMAPNPVPMAIPIPAPVTINGAPVDPCQEPCDSPTFTPPERSHEVYDSSVLTSHDSIPVTTNSNMSKHERDQRRSVVDYDEQIAEKKRIEAEEAERDRCEEEKIMREREAQIRREEEEQRKHLETEYLREQEKERVRKVLEEALERAKHEAEITRKAKVYKHVLEGADKTPGLERRILGVDPETGDRILQEINQLERHKKLDREAIDKMSPKLNGTGQREKSPNQSRFKLNTSARPRSRQTMSEAEMMSMAGNNGGKTPPRKKQIASAHQFVLADDHLTRRANEFSGIHQTPSPNNARTPFRRTDVGRMSVRVTRKEKENATVEKFRESSAQTANGSPDITVNWLVRDHRTQPSKIPTGTIPPSRTAVCGGRSSSLLHRPLKSVNHQPTVESKAARLIKGLPQDTPTSHRPISSEDFCDNPLFSPIVTRHRRPNRMRGTTNSPAITYSFCCRQP
ncbi:hypothetical protein Angca_002003 [Angiostrongylus cantonensis]|nr:hypothetical protein Angca_002003 [Angiostrongylus cantonensis]